MIASEKIYTKTKSCFQGCLPSIIFFNFFFKSMQLQDRPLRIFKKKFEQRPKGRSPGLYVAFLALKTHSSQMMKTKSCSFQISTKLNKWCQSYGQNEKSRILDLIQHSALFTNFATFIANYTIPLAFTVNFIFRFHPLLCAT